MVSSSLGCEGIDLVDGDHLLIADDARRFADAVLELMAQPEIAGRLGAEGRALMQRQYRWETATEELERFYGRLHDLRSSRDPSENVYFTKS